MNALKENEDNFDEVVFEKRNKEYGAYLLRNKYHKNVAVGLVITIILTVLLVLIPLIIICFQRNKLMSAGSGLIGSGEVEVNLTTLPMISVSEIPLAENFNSKIPIIRNDSVKQYSIHTDEDNIGEIKKENKQVKYPDGGYDQSGQIAFGGGFGSGVYGLDVVTHKPSFPGGDDAMNEFFKANIIYPELARNYKIQGTIFISFIVETDGSITNIKIIRGIGAGCDQEAERVTKLMPDWIPGKQNNNYVRVQVVIPIKFIVIPIKKNNI
jgi:periplasmic protein TonB